MANWGQFEPHEDRYHDTERVLSCKLDYCCLEPVEDVTGTGISGSLSFVDSWLSSDKGSFNRTLVIRGHDNIWEDKLNFFAG